MKSVIEQELATVPQGSIEPPIEENNQLEKTGMAKLMGGMGQVEHHSEEAASKKGSGSDKEDEDEDKENNPAWFYYHEKWTKLSPNSMWILTPDNRIR